MKIDSKMSIDKAVNHIYFRFKQPKLILNDIDREAFNTIVRELNLSYENAVMENRLLAKLLIERLLLLTIPGTRSMKNAIGILDEILDAPLNVWKEQFKKQVPLIRLSRAFEQEFVKVRMDIDDKVSCSNIREAMQFLSSEQKKSLETEFTRPYSDDEFNFFIKKLVFDMVKKHQNKE